MSVDIALSNANILHCTYELVSGEGFPEGGDLLAASGETLLRDEGRAGCCLADADAGMTGVLLALAEGVTLPPLAEGIVGVGTVRG